MEQNTQQSVRPVKEMVVWREPYETGQVDITDRRMWLSELADWT